jgi:Pyruvate/2-oxoacid:ferredoxin oxidoreductase gamma subunit/NAD-dependent dihydropyrimidine dehydrogenase PreA subunit
MKLLIAGEGGQGVQVLAKIITNTAYALGYNVSYIPHYGVEMRMGISFAFVQIQKNPISYPKFKSADILAIMTARELEISKTFYAKNTRIINVVNFRSEIDKLKLSNKSLNMILLGIIIKELNTTEFRFDSNKVVAEIKKTLSHHPEQLDENLRAYEAGRLLENEIYNHDLSKIKLDSFKPKIDKDNAKTHTKFPALCKGCGLCLEICPVKALSWNKDELNYIGRSIPKVDIEKCIACMKCEQICPDSAIKIDKK